MSILPKRLPQQTNVYHQWFNSSYLCNHAQEVFNFEKSQCEDLLWQNPQKNGLIWRYENHVLRFEVLNQRPTSIISTLDFAYTKPNVAMFIYIYNLPMHVHTHLAIMNRELDCEGKIP